MTSVRRTIVHALFLCVLVVIGANALIYASQAANPLIAWDGWHFLDTIVRKAAVDDLAAGDLFLKRSALDHSQPLRKLILLFHYHWFDLDYGIEAIIGVLAGFLNLGVFWLLVRAPRDAGEHAPPERAPIALLAFAALAAVYLSLNAAVIFNWPLLTLNYTSHFFVLLFLWSAWCGYQRTDWKGLLLLFAAALLMDVVADDTGLIATIAAVLTIALIAWRERRMRAGLQAIAMAAAAYLVYMAFYAWIVSGSALPEHAQAGVGIGNRLTGLLNHADDVLQWISVPLVAALAHRVQLRELIGADTAWAETAIALVMVMAHLWFWWRATTGRRNLSSFVATALMLLFYGLLAGMLIARVSLQGSAYLWQPRYVLIYEWNLVALLLMASGQLNARDSVSSLPGDTRVTRSGKTGRMLLAIAAALLLLLQLPLSMGTWSGLKYLSAYQQRMAGVMGAIARDPTVTPQGCAPMLLICRYNAQRRTQVIRFLQAHRLSVFSPAFRARNRLYPDADALPK